MEKPSFLACGWVVLLAACSSTSSGNDATTDAGGSSDGTVDSAPSEHDATADGLGAQDATADRLGAQDANGTNDATSAADSDGAGDTGADAGNGSDASATDAGPPGDATTCGLGLTLCNSYCVNKNNDILNCGGCGTRCVDVNPYCDNGACTTAPCSGTACGAGQFCCGADCCGAGQLCCDVPSNLPTTPQCTTPVKGTCPVGCPVCP